MALDFWEFVNDAILRHEGLITEEDPVSVVIRYFINMIMIVEALQLLFGEGGLTSQLRRDLDAVDEENRQQIQQMEDKLRQLKGQQFKTAEEALDAAADILGELVNEPRLHLVSPEFPQELDRYREVGRGLRADQKNKLALEPSRRLYDQLCAAREEYLAFEKRWVHARQNYLTAHAEAEEILARVRLLQLPVNTSLGQETAEIDCNFWSHGAVEAAAGELPSASQPEDTPIETFRTLTDRVTVLNQRISQIAEDATRAFLEAQTRLNLADSVFGELSKRGWQVFQEEDYAFRKGDERDALELKLTSPVQDQLVFTFRPDNSLVMEPHFRGVHNRDLLRQISNTLGRVLSESGIAITDISIL